MGIQSHFASAGTCKHAKVLANNTAFAYFGSPAEATQARKKLNGSRLNGSRIQVDFYNKKSEGGGITPAKTWKPQFQKQSWNTWGNSKGKGKGGGKNAPAFKVHHASGTVWLGSLPDGTNFQELKEFMATA